MASFKDVLLNYTTPVGSEYWEIDNYSFSTLLGLWQQLWKEVNRILVFAVQNGQKALSGFLGATGTVCVM